MRIHRALLALTSAALLAAGCQSLKVPSWTKPWAGEDKPKLIESKYATPVTLAVIWSPAVMNIAGNKPTRGFGGRIYFYNGKNEAVPVEGQLVVYGYNNSKANADGKTPDRKYAFTPEQFTQHFSETSLGASYSVWLPWDEVGNPEIEVSLVPIFTAASGQLVVGESSKNLLPGPKTENTATQFTSRTLSSADLVPRPYPGQQNVPPVQQASYLALPLTSQMPPARETGEVTIKLPRSLADMVATAQQPAIPERIGTSSAISASLVEAARPMASPSATPRPWTPLGQQPSIHYGRPRLPAPSWPGSLPAGGHPQTPPHP